MSPSSVHDLRSFGPRRAILVLMASLGLGASTSGCFVVTDGGNAPDPPAADPAQESIDTDAVLSVTPGHGAGLFVQYAAGGHWDVFTACDTDLTDRPCSFDVIISAEPASALSNPQKHDFEPVDTLTTDGSLHLITGTAGKLDGVTFDADPSANLRIDMLLDGEAQPDYVHWISGGLYQVTGTTTNPVDFVPASP